MNDFNDLQNKPEYQSFLKNALAFQGSVTPIVLKKVWYMVLYASLVSCLCYFFPKIILPIGPFEYGGIVMGLILVFRVNAGYDRWWEARKLWGNIVNKSRSLAISLVNFTNPENGKWINKIIKMLIVLPFLMKDNLRGNNDFGYLNYLLEEKEINRLESSEHHAMMMFSMIASELKVARESHGLDSFAFLLIYQQLEQIIDAQGACERILKTPMPFVMAVKSRRFILFFLLMLPFALASVSLTVSPLIAAVISYAFFSIDQIGIELQNPFSVRNLSHLPLDDICKTIEKNANEIMQHTNIA